MDDDELGRILDASVGGAEAGDATLARIRRRASMRRRRMAGATALAVLVVGGGATAGALALGTRGGAHVAPARQPTTTTEAATTTTTVPHRPYVSHKVSTGTTSTTVRTATTGTAGTQSCASDAITVTIDPNFEGTAGTWHWPVIATAHTTAPCRIGGVIEAAILDASGAIITTIPGNPAQHPPVGDGFVDLLQPNIPTVVAHLGWANPCSDGPVRLEVTGFAPTAHLDLARQPCAAGPIGTSHFQVERAG